MTYQDDDLVRLLAWLIEDTGSESEAAELLPVAERLASFPGVTVPKTAQATLTSLLIRELQASRGKSARKRTIVCVDDEPYTIELISLILTSRGFDVLGAVGGQEGLELIAQTRPDLVLLDLMMPDMSGWDVYQQMKANEQMKSIPVIALTAKAQSIDKVLGLHIAKVEDYITKPFSPNDLIEIINRVLARTDEDS